MMPQPLLLRSEVRSEDRSWTRGTLDLDVHVEASHVVWHNTS